MRINVADLRFDEGTTIVLTSGKEVRPLEAGPVELDAGWFAFCAFGYAGGDGNEVEGMVKLTGEDAEIAMIRGAQVEGGRS